MKTLELPTVLERYRTDIEHQVRLLLESRPDGLYNMLRYHFGWIDTDGHPAAHALGKGLRPTLCLLTCEAVGGNWRLALPAAAALELTHNFSLIHDDIQDGDLQRHHRPTVWAVWGQAQAINAGDAAFALGGIAMEHLYEGGFRAETILAAWQLLNTATLQLVEGQYLDLVFEERADITVDEYLAMIARKTGALIEAAIHIGALLGAAEKAPLDHLRWYGRALGLAFQVGDDLLGIWGQTAETGKSVAADLRRRKKSLPVIYAMQHSSPEDRAILTELYAKEQRLLDDGETEVALGVLERAHAEERTRDFLADYCSRALLELERAHLPDWARTEFAAVARFLAERRA